MAIVSEARNVEDEVLPRWKSQAFRDGVLVGAGTCIVIFLAWTILS